MVVVPAVLPTIPPVKRNPVFLYYEDRFQKPTPFKPDIVVDISSVWNKKVDDMDAHESQFYEFQRTSTRACRYRRTRQSARSGSPNAASRYRRLRSRGCIRSGTARGKTPWSTMRRLRSASTAHSPMRRAFANCSRCCLVPENSDLNTKLRELPSVDEVMQRLDARCPRELLAVETRRAIDRARDRMKAGERV